MKKGFTLAEILLALSIVGIIAVLTVPVFMGSYKEKIYASSLKKTYTEITTAITALLADEQAGDNQNFYNTSAGVSNSSYNSGAQYFLDNYFKLVKNTTKCSNTSNPCYKAGTYHNKAGNNGTLSSDYKCALISTGALVCMKVTGGRAYIVVDVNGKRSPNTVGEDVFSFYIQPDGTVVDVYDLIYTNNCNSASSGSLEIIASGCFNDVMKNGWKVKMD